MHQIVRRYLTHKGLDLKSSDLNRDVIFASTMRNAQYRESGAPEKRKGWQRHSASQLGFGAFNYKYVDLDDQPQEIALSVGRALYKLLFTTITVGYAGAESAAYLSLYFDPTTSQYRCTIIEGTTQVLDLALGLGTEGVPVTIADLDTAISALTGFTATVSGDGTVPAAFLKIVRNIEVKADNWEGVAGYWSEVNSTITNPFDGSYTRRNNIDFENVSAVNLSNVIYFSNGYDEMLKYDGQTLYRAGLPVPASVASALAAGGVTGTNYFHRARYVQYDNAGNIIEGNILAVTTGLSPAGESMNVTVANVLAASGFNTNCAIVAGAQVTVNTITVDDGSGGANTMKVGDVAYFFDSVSASYVERIVSARTATTITVAGAAVTVADNAVISNNLRIQIQRNKTSATTPTVFYEVVEVPNNSFAATQVVNDNLADASLGAIIEPPATDRSLPPKGKYITSFQDLLFVTGNPSDPKRVSWSDIDSPEYFPSDSNQQKIQSTLGDNPNGIAPNGTVIAVFTNTSTHVGSGTFADGNYRFEERAANIGLESHASLAQVEGYLCWWSYRGPYKMIGGQLPQPIGLTKDGEGRISPVTKQDGFENDPALVSLFYRTKRIVAINWTKQNKLLFFIPCESLSGSDRYANENSQVFAYDYTRDAWLQWDNINMIGGALLYGDELYFKGREVRSSTIVSDLKRFHNLNDAWDYQDNDEPIDWMYGPQWEDLKQPGVLKKFLKIEIFSLEEVQNNEFTLTVQQEMNFQDGAVIAEFDIDMTGSGYGQSAYGTEPYGDPSNPKFFHDLARLRTVSTRTKFTNNEPQQNCVISGWEFLVATPYRPEFKK